MFEKCDNVSGLQDTAKRLTLIEEERAALTEKLAVETELAAEAEEQKNRLMARTQEQGQYLEELQLRLEEEEEKVSMAKKEKSNLQDHIKDLEDQYVCGGFFNPSGLRWMYKYFLGSKRKKENARNLSSKRILWIRNCANWKRILLKWKIQTRNSAKRRRFTRSDWRSSLRS